MLPAPILENECPEKPLDLSVDVVKRLTHAYLNTSQSLADLGVELGVPVKVLRAAIKQFGLDKTKQDAIAEAQRTEQAAYVNFLVENRVPTAQRHLEISNQLVEIVGKLADKVGSPEEEGFREACEDLKKSIGTLRTLAEVLEKSSGVGARSVSLGSLNGGIGSALQQLEVPTGGRQPLITFNLGAAAGPKQAEAIDI